MHCCVLHCLNFPVVSLSGGVVGKEGTKEKEVSPNLMVSAAGVFCRWEFEELDGLWERVGWGKYTAADYSRRHRGNQAITFNMEQFSSQIARQFTDSAMRWSLRITRLKNGSDIPSWELPKKPALQCLMQCLKISPALRGSHQSCSSV